MVLREVCLEDKYTTTQGQVYMTGIQALVRLPMLQSILDRHAGLNTQGFISGYRGSPLGGLDLELGRSQKYLDTHGVKVWYGINEDLAATAVWGSQQLGLFDGAKVDGVFGLWYGKGPGVDRSADALKHANAAGSSHLGGVLVVVGDDHAAKSSTLPHQSDQVLMSCMIPVLQPSNVQEYLEYGLHGWAMSRHSGLWIALKAISDTVESASVVTIDVPRWCEIREKTKTLKSNHLNIQWPDPPLEQEKRLLNERFFALFEYVRLHHLNKIIWSAPSAKCGIISTGKSYLDTLQALDFLSYTQDIGALRLLKIAMVWPLEAKIIEEFAKDLSIIIVIEEKRALIESQVKEILYGRESCPKIIGKTESSYALSGHNWVFAPSGELSPIDIAEKIYIYLSSYVKLSNFYIDQYGIQKNLREARKKDHPEGLQELRAPHYCSGCPHNISTKIPEGSRALAGIGCHYMATWISPNTKTYTHMGGEGVPWIGQSPFTKTQHVFANLGDGTYFHSGILAIRASLSAGVSITYKLLYNDAVAMTGGQHVDGILSVPMIVQQLKAEGVRKIMITSDDPEKYQGTPWGSDDVQVFDRRQLDSVQRELRAYVGVSVLIHDQTCAAEKRRRRKRGAYPNPKTRLFIHPEVCEGCGDCGEKSGCLSILPLETVYGRKRQIDQSSCNKDYSCVEGFCPSFITLENAELRKNNVNSSTPSLELPSPSYMPLDDVYNIIIAGVGGTGIVTLGQILGMAIHLEGGAVSVMDMAGLAQKGGAVWSHIRLARDQSLLTCSRIPHLVADVILTGDIVVASGDEVLAKANAGYTQMIVNQSITPTSQFLKNKDHMFGHDDLLRYVEDVLGDHYVHQCNASTIAQKYLGDAVYANMFLLGFAWQRSWIPVSEPAILRSMELNQAQVEKNKQAFFLGRCFAHDPNILNIENGKNNDFSKLNLSEFIRFCQEHLYAYQGHSLVQRFNHLIQKIRLLDDKFPERNQNLTYTVAKVYTHVLAYKDEYEVARLFSDSLWLKSIEEQFEPGFKIYFNLAPTWLSWSGKKICLGPWMRIVFRLLAPLKFLRGTWADPFSYQKDRIFERRLIKKFESLCNNILEKTKSEKDYEDCLNKLSEFEKIRGYGHVKSSKIIEIMKNY
jgi:indolepyruvate ferredoxin oxidoreductase